MIFLAAVWGGIVCNFESQALLHQICTRPDQSIVANVYFVIAVPHTILSSLANILHYSINDARPGTKCRKGGGKAFFDWVAETGESIEKFQVRWKTELRAISASIIDNFQRFCRPWDLQIVPGRKQTGLAGSQQGQKISSNSDFLLESRKKKNQKTVF